MAVETRADAAELFCSAIGTLKPVSAFVLWASLLLTLPPPKAEEAASNEVSCVFEEVAFSKERLCVPEEALEPLFKRLGGLLWAGTVGWL